MSETDTTQRGDPQLQGANSSMVSEKKDSFVLTLTTPNTEKDSLGARTEISCSTCE